MLLSISQFICNSKKYFLSNKSRAPIEDAFKITGPLIPQWVIRRGPKISIFVFRIFILTLFNAIPDKLIIGSLGILKVKSDGMGLIILWPNIFNQSNPFNFGDPPEAIITLSKDIEELVWLKLIIHFDLTFDKALTDFNNSILILLFSHSLTKQSIIDCELFEIGKTLPSGSTFKGTPLVSNQFLVSKVPNWWNIFFNFLPPLGYALV